MILEFSDDNLVVKNLVINCYMGIQVITCVGTEIRQNLLNSSLWGFPVSVGIDFMFINDSKITYNVFAGDYTDLIKLAESHFNTVSHNIAYIAGYISPDEFPIYIVFIAIGAIGLVTVLLVVRTMKRKRKQN